MKGRVSGARMGRVDVPMGKASGKGQGVNKRDSATATGTSAGGGTKFIRRGEVKRTTGSNAKYR